MADPSLAKAARPVLPPWTIRSRILAVIGLLLVGAAAGVELEYAVVERLFHAPCPPVSAALPILRTADYTRQGATAPHVIERPIAYPWAGQFASLEGKVQLEIFVQPDGHVAQPRLIKSSGFCPFDVAALQAIPGWRYQPAVRRGTAFGTWWITEVVFRLTGEEPPAAVSQTRAGPGGEQSLQSRRAGH